MSILGSVDNAGFLLDLSVNRQGQGEPAASRPLPTRCRNTLLAAGVARFS